MVLYFSQVACSPPLPYLPVNEVANTQLDLEVLTRARPWSCEKSLHSLFRDFLPFYATSFRWGLEVVAVRSGQRAPDASAVKLLRGAWRPGGLHIQDPYETGRDLGDTLQKQTEQALRAALAAAAGVPVAAIGASVWQ